MMIDYLFIYLFIYLAPAECSVLSSWSSRKLRDAAEYTFISGTGTARGGAVAQHPFGPDPPGNQSFY